MLLDRPKLVSPCLWREGATVPFERAPKKRCTNSISLLGPPSGWDVPEEDSTQEEEENCVHNRKRTNRGLCERRSSKWSTEEFVRETFLWSCGLVEAWDRPKLASPCRWRGEGATVPFDRGRKKCQPGGLIGEKDKDDHVTYLKAYSSLALIMAVLLYLWTPSSLALISFLVS